MQFDSQRSFKSLVMETRGESPYEITTIESQKKSDIDFEMCWTIISGFCYVSQSEKMSTDFMTFYRRDVGGVLSISFSFRNDFFFQPMKRSTKIKLRSNNCFNCWWPESLKKWIENVDFLLQPTIDWNFVWTLCETLCKTLCIEENHIQV